MICMIWMFRRERIHLLALGALLGCALLWTACEDQKLADGLPEEITCTSCHGGDFNDAPPPSLDGATAESDPGVGAHQDHLEYGIACEGCHVVPEALDSPGHLDANDPTPGRAEVRFDMALASSNGATPAWDPETLTCSGVYCHGATLSGGSNNAPVWNGGEEQAECGTCHGTPPPAPHPPIDTCDSCHPGESEGKHINGTLDADLTCSSCHGDEDSAAPPLALDGASATTDPGVGAHRDHLEDGEVRAALKCTACHVLPQTVDAPGHIDDEDGVAELTWSSLATGDGATTPEWDRTAATCSSVYCHGATLDGGSNTSPKWTLVDGSQAACGSCHGFPPPPPHPPKDTCGDCHGETMTEIGAIDIAGGKHIDGEVELGEMACNTCHGNDSNAAPPVAVDGASSTDDVTVGAHQRHLGGGQVRDAIACSDCHKVPTAYTDEGHLGESPAELTWSDFATHDGELTPAWDREAASCSNVYCHGGTLSGGTHQAPVWTTVDGSQLTCESCHGFPPPLPHPAKDTCNDCHSATVTAAGAIDLEGGQHIDGELDVDALACNTCHGNADNAAPPVSLSGSSSTAEVAVGAHQSHVKDGELRKAIGCDECHTVPAEVGDAGHIGASPAELSFGDLATKSGGLTPAWDHDTATCSNVYCHGATLNGGLNTEPVWTTVNGSQISCFGCHGFPPPAPHPNTVSCNDCHKQTIADQGGIDVEAGTHINGKTDF